MARTSNTSLRAVRAGGLAHCRTRRDRPEGNDRSQIAEVRTLPGSTVRLGASVATLSLRGELDLASSDELNDLFAPVVAEPPRRLLIDLSELEFMDRAGAGLLVAARNNLPDSEVVLIGARRSICRVVELLKLERVFSIENRVHS